jgi:hypothetical protein
MANVLTFEQLKRTKAISLGDEKNVLINNVSLFDINEITVDYIDHECILIRFIGMFGDEVASISLEEHQQLEIDGTKLTVL